MKNNASPFRLPLFLTLMLSFILVLAACGGGSGGGSSSGGKGSSSADIDNFPKRAGDTPTAYFELVLALSKFYYEDKHGEEFYFERLGEEDIDGQKTVKVNTQVIKNGETLNDVHIWVDEDGFVVKGYELLDDRELPEDSASTRLEFAFKPLTEFNREYRLEFNGNMSKVTSHTTENSELVGHNATIHSIGAKEIRGGDDEFELKVADFGQAEMILSEVRNGEETMTFTPLILEFN